MLHVINSTVQAITGYSFSVSNIPKNINKVGLQAIALLAAMYLPVVAKEIKESYTCETACLKAILPYIVDIENINFCCIADECKRICNA